MRSSYTVLSQSYSYAQHGTLVNRLMLRLAEPVSIVKLGLLAEHCFLMLPVTECFEVYFC